MNRKPAQLGITPIQETNTATSAQQVQDVLVVQPLPVVPLVLILCRERQVVLLALQDINVLTTMKLQRDAQLDIIRLQEVRLAVTSVPQETTVLVLPQVLLAVALVSTQLMELLPAHLVQLDIHALEEHLLLLQNALQESTLLKE